MLKLFGGLYLNDHLESILKRWFWVDVKNNGFEVDDKTTIWSDVKTMVLESKLKRWYWSQSLADGFGVDIKTTVLESMLKRWFWSRC
jgi:hypothetical protein